jgi:DNA-binding protein YbaB
MFDKLKAMGALAGLVKDKDKIKDAFERVKDKLARARLAGSSGGGAVRATVSGQMKVIDIEISPALAAGIAADDRTRLLAGGLIAEAVNDALTQAQSTLKTAIELEAKALGLPDLGGLANSFG